MELPFITAIRTKMLGDRRPNPYFDWCAVRYDVEHPPATAMIDEYVDYRSSATVFFQQTAPLGESELVRQTAIRSMARHVYGPIEAELRDILATMWQEGLHHSKAAKKIDALLPVLRGEIVSTREGPRT